MSDIKLLLTGKRGGEIDRINAKQNRIRKLARDNNMDRGRLLNYYQRPDLMDDDDKDIQNSMGKEEMNATMDAIGFQEAIGSRVRDKSGSFSITKGQFLNGARQIRVMGEILDITIDNRITNFRRGYVDLLNKSNLILLDVETAIRAVKPNITQTTQAVKATKDYLFYAIYKGDYEAYIGRTENRNFLDPMSDIDRRKGQHQAARSEGYSILLSGGEMTIIDSAQGITEGEADIREDWHIDDYLTRVKIIRNEKYNVAGRGFVHSRRKNAPTTTDSKRQGAEWGSKITNSVVAMKAFDYRIMDTLKFLNDNPKIKPNSVHNNDTLKRHGHLPECVGVTITRQRLIKYRRNILKGFPHNKDICDNWSGIYSPINIPLSEFK